MENAPSYLPVYTDPDLAPDVDPDSVRAYLLSGNCLPLALVAVEPTPGQIRLVRPVPLPDDPQHAVSLQRILNNIRVLRQNLVIAGDSKALLMQEANFTFLTCLLMKERGFGAIANWWWWRRMFASRTVVALAEFLYERHGDVRLRPTWRLRSSVSADPIRGCVSATRSSCRFDRSLTRCPSWGCGLSGRMNGSETWLA